MTKEAKKVATKWMSTLGVFGAALAMVSVLGGVAVAAPISAQIRVDGKLVGEIQLDSDDGKVFTGGYNASKPGEWEIDVDLLMDEDPEIVYAGSVIDFGAASTFGFNFVQSIVPTGTPGTATHTFSGSTTDGGGGVGTPVMAVPPPGGIPSDGPPDEMSVYTLSTNGGATYLNAGLDLGPSFLGSSPSDTFGPFAEGPAAGPAGSGAYDRMRVDVNFSLAGNNDVFTFNGRATIVPEPSSLLLLGAIAWMLALCIRRRA